MLYALLIICASATSESCVIFQDTRGPYVDVKACSKRLEEMLPSADEAFIQLFPDTPGRTADGWCTTVDPKTAPHLDLEAEPAFSA